VRNGPGTIVRRVAIALGLLVAGYMALHNGSADWPRVSVWLDQAGIGPGVFVGQASSLLVMSALLLVFALKRLDVGFLHLFGVYSYETYLLHWPLMSRYDLFYHHLPAWAATFAWLAAFIGIGWLLQRITTPLGAWVDRLGAR